MYYKFFYPFVKYFAIIVEILLIIRVVSRFLGASEKALMVKWLYKITGALIYPFNFIFPNVRLYGGVLDIVAISAIVGYFILIVAAVKLFKLFFGEK